MKAKFHYAIQLANQLASWFASLAGLRPASEHNGIWPIRHYLSR